MAEQRRESWPAGMTESDFRNLLGAGLGRLDDAWCRGDKEAMASQWAPDIVLNMRRQLGGSGAFGREQAATLMGVPEYPNLQSELLSVVPPGVAVTRQRAFDDLGNETPTVSVVRVASDGLVTELTIFDDDVRPEVIDAEVERLAAG